MIPEVLYEDVGAVRLKMTDRLRNIFERRSIYFNRARSWPSEVLMRKSARVEPYTGFFKNFIFTMGALSYTDASIPNVYEVEMGRYCSIGPGVRIMGEGHPTERVTSSAYTYIPMRSDDHPNLSDAARDFGPYRGVPNSFRSGVTRIGHDVWIATDVYIKPGISIGTGAVIATGAIVTKDVPPYAMVGGAPGRVLKMRFPEDLAERLLQSKWWEYSPRVLSQFEAENPERFLEQIAEKNPDRYFPDALTWNTLQEKLRSESPSTSGAEGALDALLS